MGDIRAVISNHELSLAYIRSYTYDMIWPQESHSSSKDRHVDTKKSISTSHLQGIRTGAANAQGKYLKSFSLRNQQNRTNSHPSCVSDTGMDLGRPSLRSIAVVSPSSADDRSRSTSHQLIIRTGAAHEQGKYLKSFLV